MGRVLYMANLREKTFTINAIVHLTVNAFIQFFKATLTNGLLSISNMSTQVCYQKGFSTNNHFLSNRKGFSLERLAMYSMLYEK